MWTRKEMVKILKRGSRPFSQRRRKAFWLAGLLPLMAVSTLMAQDDVTTQNGSSGYGGGWITGPASNPLSFLNGPAYRTFGNPAPYDLPDFRPASQLDEHLPDWIQFGVEARLRYEAVHNSGFKKGVDDSYLVLRQRY